MKEIRIGDQTIRYDRAATAAKYADMQNGDAEACGCVFCRNFAHQRDLVYPATFRQLLCELGIDPRKEGEVFEYGPAGDGCRLYGGWFYLVGELVTANDRNPRPPDSNSFTFWFTTNCPDAPAFGEGPLLAVEFIAPVKWELPECPD